MVRDHGRCIPEGEHSPALEPFTKVSPARGTKGSAGLGLAIAARVVRSHGGEVPLHNRRDTGFEVRVTFTPATATPDQFMIQVWRVTLTYD